MMEFRSGLYVIDLGVMLELVSSPKNKNSAFIFELHPKTSSRISSVLSDTLKLILVAHEMLLSFSGNRESGTSGQVRQFLLTYILNNGAYMCTSGRYPAFS